MTSRSSCLEDEGGGKWEAEVNARVGGSGGAVGAPSGAATAQRQATARQATPATESPPSYQICATQQG